MRYCAGSASVPRERPTGRSGRTTLFALCSTLLLCAKSSAQQVDTLNLFSGPGEESGPAGGGSCGYGTLSANSWPSGDIASISSSDALVADLPSNGCGACVQIACADPSTCRAGNSPTVLIVDSCPECSLTIPAAIFADVQDPSVGHADVTVKQVDCEPTDNIVIRILEFRPSAGGYLKLVLLNVAGSGAISSLGIRMYQTSDAFQALDNTYGAVWEATTLPGLPLDLQITSAGGSSVIVQGAISEDASGDVPTIVQFPSSSAAATAPVPAPAASSPPPVLLPPAPELITPAVSPAEPAITPAAQTEAPFPVPDSEPEQIEPPTPAGTATGSAASGPRGASVPVGTSLPQGASSAGPVVQLGTGPGGCSTVLAVLQSQPSLATWTQLLTDSGDAAALNSDALKLTMFAPTDEAFTSAIASGESAAGLLASQPSLQAPLIGYHIVGGYYPSSLLRVGAVLTTTDYVQGTDGQKEQLTVTVGRTRQINAAGSIARILTPDLQACGGPSVVHIIDNVLLPFNASSI